MPLDQRFTFKAVLRKENRLRVPRAMMGQFKLEPTQMLKVTLTLALVLGDKESFFGKVRKDGYITVPPLAVALLKGDMPSLENHALEVTLEPA